MIGSDVDVTLKISVNIPSKLQTRPHTPIRIKQLEIGFLIELFLERMPLIKIAKLPTDVRMKNALK